LGECRGQPWMRRGGWDGPATAQVPGRGGAGSWTRLSGTPRPSTRGDRLRQHLDPAGCAWIRPPAFGPAVARGDHGRGGRRERGGREGGPDPPPAAEEIRRGRPGSAAREGAKPAVPADLPSSKRLTSRRPRLRRASTRPPPRAGLRRAASAPPWPPPSPRCRGRRELEVGREKGGSSRLGGRREGAGGWRGKRVALTAGRPPPSAAGESRGEWMESRRGEARYWPSTVYTHPGDEALGGTGCPRSDTCPWPRRETPDTDRPICRGAVDARRFLVFFCK
jgi:hypothetical protein